jgi:hypothetical protein
MLSNDRIQIIPPVFYCQRQDYFAIKRRSVTAFQLWLAAQGREHLRQLEISGIGSIASMTIAQMAANAVKPVPGRGAAKC